jgi:hypothetical protein
MSAPIKFETRITNPMIKPAAQSIRLHRLTKVKSLVLAALLVGALFTLPSTPLKAAQASGQVQSERLGNTFSILLSGKYRPVVQAPNLGLSKVDLNDGSYSITKIYRVSGLPVEDRDDHDDASLDDRKGDRNLEKKAAIGNFYVQFNGNLAAYDLPGGALAMVFTNMDTKAVPDGQGGTYMVGTYDLNIVEATGRYHAFLGGHNKMVDILHQLPDGSFIEHCICIITRA